MFCFIKGIIRLRCFEDLKIHIRLSLTVREDLSKIPIKQFIFCEVVECKSATALKHKLHSKL